ncbi:MAG: hypothetical protein FH753_13185 [Firmicutes bacterium]|nr:hypothetical protein [Bacillota bacterium]
MDDVRINKYIEEVCNRISKDAVIKEIKEELYDHILGMTEDYKEAGFSYDEAVDKTLKQMGNPKKVGKGLNNAHRDRFNYSIMGITIFTVMVVLFTGFFGMKYSSFDKLEWILFAILAPVSVFYNYKILSGILKGKYNEEPIFYIRRVYGLSSMDLFFIWIFGFQILLMLFGNIMDFIEYDMDIFQFFSMVNILNIFFIEILGKRRSTPIYSNGLQQVARFVKWEDMKSYRWIKSHRKGKIIYELKIELKRGVSQVIIKVNKGQIDSINKLLKKKIS